MRRFRDEIKSYRAAIPDVLWEELNAHWQADQIIEMLILCGWYHAISYVANVAGLPLEAWAARFSPA